MPLFLARFVVAFVGLLPGKSKFTWKVEVVFDYIGCREKVIKWHLFQLEKLDPKFRFRFATIKSGHVPRFGGGAVEKITKDSGSECQDLSDYPVIPLGEEK